MYEDLKPSAQKVLKLITASLGTLAENLCDFHDLFIAIWVVLHFG